MIQAVHNVPLSLWVSGQAWHAHLDQRACRCQGVPDGSFHVLFMFFSGFAWIFSICISGSKKVKSMELPWWVRTISQQSTPFGKIRCQILEKERIVEVADVERVAREASGTFYKPPFCKDLVKGCSCFIPKIPWYWEMAVGLDLNLMICRNCTELFLNCFGHLAVSWQLEGAYFEAHPAPAHCLTLSVVFVN